MAENLKEVVIPKEKAVFRMDGNGRWHNVHGEFRHKKLIDYFNSSIGRDKNGYFVSQTRGDIFEKVYFPYEKTALFVFDVIKNDDIVLVLNTKKRIILQPEKLTIKDDSLFMSIEDEIVKFTDRSMMKLSDCIDYENGQYYFKTEKEKYSINELE